MQSVRNGNNRKYSLIDVALTHRILLCFCKRDNKGTHCSRNISGKTAAMAVCDGFVARHDLLKGADAVVQGDVIDRIVRVRVRVRKRGK